MGKGRPAPDLSGEKFGRWLVVRREPGVTNSGHARFHCRCECGNEGLVLGHQLRRGTSLSCGCLRNDLSSQRMKKHGLSNHRLFPIWDSMMQRCYNPDNAAYANYGGRGITVCNRWHDVTHFIADNEALAKPRLTLDREDNDGPYSPENTRWATRATQALNRRSNVFLTHDGRTQTLFEWAREVGIRPRTLWQRIKLEWPIEDALTMKVDASNRRSSLITFRGYTDTLPNHARRHGVDPRVVWTRVNRYGWSLERALTTRNRRG